MARHARRRAWIEHQGRANAALMLLARDMSGEFSHPGGDDDFATVRGRAAGCSFELQVASRPKRQPERLVLTLRNSTQERVVHLHGPGCEIPALDPGPLRAAIERACREFAAGHGAS
jgi:hypothetical protein